jgi:protein-S-isoprenylcysteine O-methyltransferase Ste14
MGRALLTSMVITGYFIIGAFLEERKLLAEFGEEYIGYQRRVSMLFPFKWVIHKLTGPGIRGKDERK